MERSFAPEAESLTGQCMLDWPEQIHTSPVKMSWMVILLEAETTRLTGTAVATLGSILSRQLPRESVVVCLVWLPKVTETASPGVAVPQTGMGLPHWSTMWLPKTGDSVTSAERVGRRKIASSRAMVNGLNGCFTVHRSLG